MLSRADRVRLKAKRAKEHIRDFQAASARFFKEKPSFVDAKRDPDTRQVIYYIDECPAIPDDLLLIAGDAIQNLRSALDHLIWELVDAHSGKPAEKIGARLEFPVCKDSSDYESRAPRKIEGIAPIAAKTISDIEPYEGGKGHEIWVLHNLNRIDKHRLLLSAVSSYRGADLGPILDGFISRFLKQALPERPLPPSFGLSSIFVLPADTRNSGKPIFPLERGTVIFVDSPDAEINKDMKFTYEIAFGEPGVAEGRSVIETLESLANLVDNLISDFEPFLTPF
jgi:hypothetical protein